jgi:hypothetical protein
MKQTIKMVSIALSIMLFLESCTYIKNTLGSKEKDEPTRIKAEEAAKAASALREELAAKADEPRNWTQYAKLKGGVVCFLDKDTITYPAKDMVQLWRKRVFPPRSGEKEIIAYDEMDCRKQKYRSLLLRVTHENDTVETFVKASPWAAVYEGSPEEYLLDTSCIEAAKAR